MKKNLETPVLQFLQKMVDGSLKENENTFFQYPTAISKLLKFNVVEVDQGHSKISVDADAKIHGNQQGTVHGGFISELADAAIGTAHSTLIAKGESFTSLELKINFFRPVWKNTLLAHCYPIQSGKTITVYQCDISKDDGKLVAKATSTVMTLRGEQAQGR